MSPASVPARGIVDRSPATATLILTTALSETTHLQRSAMADYEFLEPRGLDLASGRSLVGPPKPPRLHSAGDLCEVTERDRSLPHISVTAPPGQPGQSRRAGSPPPPDAVDRLRLAGSFDSLDSETMVSVGEMADLGRSPNSRHSDIDTPYVDVISTLHCLPLLRGPLLYLLPNIFHTIGLLLSLLYLWQERLGFE